MNLHNEISETALDEVQKRFYGVAVGIVTDVMDPTMQGRIKVKLPWFIGDEDTAWARVATPSAGGQRGIYFIPKVDDEVLVAFEQGDIEHPYIIGSLWNLQDMPPELSPLLGKSLIKTRAGHLLEFDDTQQSITIETSTGQKTVMDPLKIELSNSAGSLKISMDNSSQTVTIESAVNLELKGVNIKIEGANVEINGTAKTDVKSTGICTIQGSLVKIN
jgi:uncharacterized protein involved in type VI secretion and phage assembly